MWQSPIVVLSINRMLLEVRLATEIWHGFRSEEVAFGDRTRRERDFQSTRYLHSN